jgi:hypothetical protein
MAASLRVNMEEVWGAESSAVGIQLVQLGSCSEIGDSQRGRDAVNTEVEGSATFEAVTREQLVKTQETEEFLRAVMNGRMCELEIAL